MNRQNRVKRTRSARRTFAGRRLVNVVGRFAATRMLRRRRTKTLRYRHLWPRKNKNHGRGQKPSCRLKATIHFLKGSPKPHPVKGPNIFLFESRMINRKRTFGIGPSPDANPLLVCPCRHHHAHHSGAKSPPSPECALGCHRLTAKNEHCVCQWHNRQYHWNAHSA